MMTRLFIRWMTIRMPHETAIFVDEQLAERRD